MVVVEVDVPEVSPAPDVVNELVVDGVISGEFINMLELVELGLTSVSVGTLL